MRSFVARIHFHPQLPLPIEDIEHDVDCSIKCPSIVWIYFWMPQLRDVEQNGMELSRHPDKNRFVLYIDISYHELGNLIWLS